MIIVFCTVSKNISLTETCVCRCKPLLPCYLAIRSTGLAFRHKGVWQNSSVVFQGLTSFLFLSFISFPNLSPDRAGHFEIPLRLVGHPVPAAQTGGGRAVSAAARRPFLPRVCRLHLPVVSAHFAMFELRLKGL